MQKNSSHKHFKKKKNRGSLLRKFYANKSDAGNAYSQSVVYSNDPMQMLKAQYSAANYDAGDYPDYGASPKTNDYFKSIHK